MSIDRCSSSSASIIKPGHAFFDTSQGSYHAALIAPGAVVNAASGLSVKVCHMAPPLHVSGEDELPVNDRCWSGWFAELGDDAYRAICAFALGLRQKLTPSADLQDLGYRLSPHGVDLQETTDPNDPAEQVFTAFASCASFLEGCYEAIKVDLVDAASVPSIPSLNALAVVINVHPRRVSMGLHLARARAVWPCQVLLPAYQMRAFSEACDQLPHRPTLRDHPFP